MLQLKSLHLKNWCQHQERVFTFSPYTNGLVGPNGSGKSNLIAAIFFCLTGRVGDDTLEDNISNGYDAATLTLDFRYNKTDYKLVRTLKREGASTATLSAATESIRGTRKVNEFITSLTELTPFVIAEHVYISQTKLWDLLFQPKTERLKSFIALIRELDELKKIKESIDNELLRYPALNITEDESSVLKTIQKNKDDLIINHKAVEDVTAKLSVFNETSIADAVAAVEQQLNILMAVTTLDTELAQTQTALTAKELKLTEFNADFVLLQKQYQELEQKMPDCLTVINNYTTVSQVTAERTRLTKEINRLQQELEQLSANQPPDGTDENKLYNNKLSEIQTTRDALTRQKHELNTLNPVNGTVCPIDHKPCQRLDDNRSIIDKLIADVTSKIQAIEQTLQRLNNEAADANAKFNATRSTFVNWHNSISSYNASLTANKASLAALPDIQPIDDARLNECKAIEKEFLALKPIYTTSDRMVMSLTSEIENMRKTVSAITLKRDTAKQGLTGTHTLDSLKQELAGHKQALTTVNSLKTQQATLNATIGALQSNIKILEETMLTTIQRSTKIAKYRKLLDDVKSVIHPTNLPSSILQAYISRINSLCNMFLEKFGKPFVVDIDNEMEFTVTFLSGYSAPITRLSGGQKCVLSVALRLAINELFSKHVGLLILDEPTAFMDTTNINYMSDMIEYIKTTSKTTNVQTIIITHHDALIPSFDSVISL